MMHCVDDTITAIASAPGGGVRGVIRLSGPETLSCLQRCFRAATGEDLARVTRPMLIAGHVQVADPIGPLACDVYFWPTKRSYTRQVSAELHTIGSPPLLDAVVRTLCDCGARLARPGEFTLRAFLAGRLDLTQAEAVLGVIDAEDTQALNVALRQLAGGLAAPLGQLRCDLLDVLAQLEAGLDFADEDIEFIEAGQIASRVGDARSAIEALLQRISSRGQIAHEPTVVVRGWPNVGKSSLINALAGSAVAIVSRQAGTTRDYVTKGFRWHGLSGVLVDTPGVQEDGVTSPLSAAAQQMAAEQASHAELELFCCDATRGMNAWERHMLAQRAPSKRLVVWTKVDAGVPDSDAFMADAQTSSLSGQGIKELRALICERLGASTARPAMAVASTAERCRHSLESAATSLERAARLAKERLGDELIAVELRHALDCLGAVVGAIYTDDILERIFSRFCIGK